MRKTLAALLGSAAIVMAAGTAAGARTTADPVSGVEWWQTPDSKEITTRLNGYRNAVGLPTLPADGVVSYWAEVHAAEMAQANSLHHSDMNFLLRATGCATVAENVAFAPSVEQAHVALVNSPGHRDNMTAGWRLVGTGVASGNGLKWVTEIFCTW